MVEIAATSFPHGSERKFAVAAIRPKKPNPGHAPNNHTGSVPVDGGRATAVPLAELFSGGQNLSTKSPEHAGIHPI